MSREDCLHLLAGADLARVVLSVRALPAALPARISLVDDDHLLLVSHEDAVILAARRGDVISVQIDGLEGDGSTWSVMTSGIASSGDATVQLRSSMREAVDNGAALLQIPLSVLVGQRSR
ncbi:MAG: hypothetical protein HKL86_00460 [Acidimicrobiaceae bacterium]|nr:hypothetical protein [Acidimicrobiaceae bacterium]